jgi:selenocysteine-specific elongation factor
MEEYIIVGTAGHVDHGKTVLVQALTGVNTDRLKEEKERGISIELGFAPLELPSGRRVGLVDVPGHERFVKQMLAGVGGMDLVILVVAADEGVMPQTREHLDIINLLQIKKGLVVITKKDLVEEEWLELVMEEVKEAVQDTVLAGAPVLAVSAYTGEGMEELRRELDQLAANTPPKPTEGKVRLPVDRVFSITGFGTVVTGTLWSGQICTGDLLEIQPQGQQVRVRTLQVHERKVDVALAGQRTAVNLAGIEVGELERGSTLVTPGTLTPSHRVDLQLFLLPKAQPLTHRQRVRVHLGTSEVLGRVILLDREELAPGETALAQLQMEELLVAARQDRLIIRSYSPMTTIAGGLVIDPHASRHRRYKKEVLQRLNTLLQGDPLELIEEVLTSSKVPLPLAEIASQTGLSIPEVEKTLAMLLEKGEVQSFSFEEATWYLPRSREEKWLQEVEELLDRYHRKYPLRAGFPKEELRSRKFSALPVKVFNGLLQRWEEKGKLKIAANSAALPDFQGEPSADEKVILEQALSLFRQDLFQPPAWEEVVSRLGIKSNLEEEMLSYLLRVKELVKVADGLYFHREAVEQARELIRRQVQEKGSVELAEMRDALNSSRKYVLPLLEYFDQVKFTKRVGDKRVLF